MEEPGRPEFARFLASKTGDPRIDVLIVGYQLKNAEDLY
jgi:hypothetical protein